MSDQDGVCRLYPIVDKSMVPPIKRQKIFDKVFGTMEQLRIIETNNCINKTNERAEREGGRKVRFSRDGSWQKSGYALVGKKNRAERFGPLWNKKLRKDPADLCFSRLVQLYRDGYAGYNWVF